MGAIELLDDPQALHVQPVPSAADCWGAFLKSFYIIVREKYREILGSSLYLKS